MTSEDLDHIHELVDARKPELVQESIRRLFGTDARLYAVDHDNRSLVEVFGDGSLRLEGDLRAALLATHVHTENGTTWIPVAERRHPTFAVAVTEGAAGLRSSRVATVLGPVMATHRRRFEEVEDRRRRSNMSVAAELQWDLLPASSDAFDSWGVSGALEPAYEVAGDLFDYGWTAGSIWAYSLDGMGHGTEATLTGSVALAAIRNARHEGEDLDGQMVRASDALHDVWKGDRFVTGVACRLDHDGVSYVNAGHEPVRRVTKGAVSREDLDADLPLGVEPTPDYSIQTRPGLEPGDGIALFSDGVVGATSSAGASLGSEALEVALTEHWTPIPLLTAQRVIEVVMSHIGQERVSDDVTVVIVQRLEEADAGVPHDER